MAEKGLWSIGNWNIPDFGISEKLGIGPNNAAIMDPNGMRNWPQANISIPSNIQLHPNASPALKANVVNNQTNNGSNGTPPRTYSNAPNPQPTPQSSGGLTADILRSKFGFNDQNTINNILNDPGQRQRYENEMGGGSPSGQDPFAELYQNSLNALTDAQKVLEGQAGEAAKGIDEQAGLSRSAYEQALAKSKDLYSTQKEELTNEERTLQSESIRAYNNLKQSYMTRFGGGSSTGQALAELVGQQFIRSTGQLRDKYLSGVKVLQSAERDAMVNFNQSIEKLELSIVQAKRENNANLQAEIGNINMQKAQVEDQKSAMRAEAARVAMANAQQIQANREQQLFSLGQWKLQRDEEVGRGSAFLDDLAAEVAASIKFQKQSMQDSVIQPGQFFSRSGSFNSYKSNENASDPYAEAGLINNR